MSQCVKIVFLQNSGLSKMRVSKRKLHFLFFFVMLEKKQKKEKQKKMEKAQKPCKNKVFQGGHAKM